MKPAVQFSAFHYTVKGQVLIVNVRTVIRRMERTQNAFVFFIFIFFFAL